MLPVPKIVLDYISVRFCKLSDEMKDWISFLEKQVPKKKTIFIAVLITLLGILMAP